MEVAAIFPWPSRSIRRGAASPSSPSTRTAFHHPGSSKFFLLFQIARRNRRRSSSLVVAIPGSSQFKLSTSRDQLAPSQLSRVP
ncbi:hypothetical protein PVAP13_5NG315100 [Panicum virgatum]|uniref:Uncharacterized protein n=1 Tax=Panicum virgatum TaxID=38727 RepID=A0A8T0RY69_PANVG|nr:hypothetical protein PVAP13_5NG315100 [Panicum virgatum]KAG2589996.1 hypothetical protein PVAP13_5NG315100 [Panicum virgatum]KAG2589997.1 hypothetical protein PVAP13_5NG315100 [Panicum virgatum]